MGLQARDLVDILRDKVASKGSSSMGSTVLPMLSSSDHERDATLSEMWILHDWKDEDCVKILKQCRKALPSKSGKLIIVDVVLHLKEDTSAFADSRLAFDMLMFAVTSGGLERTEEEWRALLSKGGFSNCNIKPLPTLQSIIEAYPDPKE
ncbi:O-methyltransferase 2-like [Amborella trichopoda]|uniref:O-methyltransferase 2-like n=1 Tax=Amborella trichopoda TaxID=13333 RepID=UPI0009BFAF97|nr:O-methyltransferase 2-like [Amborella trichopoda]|eukprot:XP_020521165.1 O-methyltransferase 2-like [Amborella trichopoda]